MARGGREVDHVGDHVLLAGMAAGDEHMAVAFVRRFQRTVFGIALAVIGDARLAEDVAQQAFERAWRHAGLYDPRRGTVSAWLARITHNLAVDTVRGRRTSPVDPADLETLVDRITWSPERAALAAESAAELHAAINALPVIQRRALTLAAFRGMTAREIADVEHIPLGTAKTRIRTGLLRLNRALNTAQLKPQLGPAAGVKVRYSTAQPRNAAP
jgi:RNA polymerase sigma-70 factor (ECF subfamily)